MTEAHILGVLQSKLDAKRYAHSLAVAAEAGRLAAKYGADPAKARIAGLLHDVMKNQTAEYQLQLCAEFGIILDNIEKVTEKLLHAKSGAAYIEHRLGVTDPDLLNAVRYHTTARAGMSPLEKTLYLADFTSADRDYDDVGEMRRLVDIGMKEAMRYALIYTIKDLIGHNNPIHPDTVNAYNQLTMDG